MSDFDLMRMLLFVQRFVFDGSWIVFGVGSYGLEMIKIWLESRIFEWTMVRWSGLDCNMVLGVYINGVFRRMMLRNSVCIVVLECGFGKGWYMEIGCILMNWSVFGVSLEM